MSPSSTLLHTARPCPVCGGHDAEPLHRAFLELPDGHPLSDGYDVVACQACGMAFADAAVPAEAYDAFYASLSKYEDVATGSGGGHQAWDARRLDEVAATIALTCPEPDALIVDIGCANGGLLAALNARGYRNLVGIDPSPVCVQRAGASPNVRAFVGTLAALPDEVRGAQVVLLSHVLEHVEDVAGALASTRAILADGGLMYVEVPDAERYEAYVTAPFQDFNTEHINHFSPQTLRNAVESAGFSVSEVTRKEIESAPGVPYPAVYVLATPLGPPPSSPLPAVPDEGLQSALRRYVERSTRVQHDIDTRLEEIVAQSPDLVVWGVGQTTFRLAARPALRKARILAFVDTRPTYHGRRLLGAPIAPPSAISELDAPVLVSSLINASSIRASLSAMGVERRVFLLAS